MAEKSKHDLLTGLLTAIIIVVLLLLLLLIPAPLKSAVTQRVDTIVERYQVLADQ